MHCTDAFHKSSTALTKDKCGLRTQHINGQAVNGAEAQPSLLFHHRTGDADGAQLAEQFFEFSCCFIEQGRVAVEPADITEGFLHFRIQVQSGFR